MQEENANLRSEVNRIRSEYEQLLSENASLKVILKILLSHFFAFLNCLSDDGEKSTDICCINLPHLIDWILFMQERLGEAPGNEEVRAGRNGQHSSNQNTQLTESEVVQVGNKN